MEMLCERGRSCGKPRPAPPYLAAAAMPASVALGRGAGRGGVGGGWPVPQDE